MPRNKHILDLRETRRNKKPQDTVDIFSRAGFGYDNYDDHEADNNESIFKREKLNISKSDFFDTPETKRKISAPEFNFHTSWFDDIAFAIKQRFRKRRLKHHQNLLTFPEDENYSHQEEVVKVARQSFSLMKWLVIKIGTALGFIIRFLRALMLGPIAFLDRLLDKLAYFFKLLFKGIFRYLVIFLKIIAKPLENVEFNPPYFWYRKLGNFILIAVLVIAPIKLFFEVPKILKAKQEVLGISSKAFGYFGLFSQLQDYLPAAEVAKEFGGFNGPRRYLVVFQNNAELRPTGGFMGSYAQIDIDSGIIEAIDVPTGGFYDLKGYTTNKLEAPQPFHMFSPYWQIWNSNWFAHFPASAKQLSWFYENSTGPTTDGVITLTPNIVEDFLALTGPIELPEYEVTINHENFREKTQIEVELEYDKEANTPKAFIGSLTTELMDRLFVLINEDRAEALLEILDKSLDEKQLLLYSTNPEIQKTLEDLNWAGAVRLVPHDYLQVVHTNIGGGKTDRVIADQIDQKITVSIDGTIKSRVELTRSHQGNPEDLFTGHDNLDYLRFYVPLGSKLISATGFTQDDLTSLFKTTEETLQESPVLDSLKNATIDLASGTQVFDEIGKTVFGNWLGLKPGQSKTVMVEYELPFKLTENIYHFYWQKQSGTEGTPIKVSVELPDNLQFTSWIPQDSHIQLVSDNTLIYTNDLRVDRWLSFGYK